MNLAYSNIAMVVVVVVVVVAVVGFSCFATVSMTKECFM
jgi:hypothetical protein